MQHKNQILLCFTLRKHLDIVATSFALKIHLVATPTNYETITKNVKKNRILQNFAKENNFKKFTAKKLYRL